MRSGSIVLLIIFTSLPRGDSQCVQPSTLRPFCSLRNNDYVACDGIRSTSALDRLLRSIEGCRLNLELDNLVLEKLPRGIFNRTLIGSLVFKNFSLSQLADEEPGPSPFYGLENSLHTLGIIGSMKSIRHWNWKELSELRSLETLSIGRGYISMVSRSFSLINKSSLSRLQMTGSCIDGIEDYALGNFYQLETLNLEGNMLSLITRATFPTLAPKLEIISLRHNLLDILGEGTFNNMPALKKLYLDGNRFNVIQENVFGPIWDQLEYLLFYGNPIRCDCKIAWIINRKPIYIRMQQPLLCQAPPDLMGEDIKYLRKERVCPSNGGPYSNAIGKKNNR